jgi:zinc/manganese transport system substrate-binding protein
MARLRRALLAAVLLGTAALPACTVSSRAHGSGGSVIQAAASINAWGSILRQLGGTHVDARSIVSNPDTDPHDYEPTTADGRTVAESELFVENGIGYDSWASKALAANPDPHRIVVDVGKVTGVGAGGNPHRWYSPVDVEKVADAITAALKRLAPKDAAYFAAQRARFDSTGLARYRQLIADIAAKYAGTPVGASESIFTPLAGALHLDLITPPSFLKAISEGTDPSPADKATIDRQIHDHEIKVYVYNSQNATPDVAAQVKAARAAGIPVTTITETLTPPGASFQQWQVAQLRALVDALARASAR